MQFNDRITLGKEFAEHLNKYKGKDAVIVCLKESALMTCIAMAMELRAWVYPLLYVPVRNPQNGQDIFGVINEDGVFCKDPTKDVPEEILNAAIYDQKTAAMQLMQQQKLSYEMSYDKSKLKGRHVILVCDVLYDVLPLVAVNQMLESVRTKSLSALVGNASPEVADFVHISADKTFVLDVISGITKDDEQYFHHHDEYDNQTKRQLTKHIATYWQ